MADRLEDVTTLLEVRAWRRVSKVPTPSDALVSRTRHLISALHLTDITGKPGWYYLHVTPSNRAAFMAQMEAGNPVDIFDYASLLASGYGDEPSQALKDLLMQRFGYQA